MESDRPNLEPGANLDERERRLTTVAFGLVVLIAAALRFWALGAGIPDRLSVDEPQVMNRAVAMLRTGDLNPRFFDYPAFYIYVQMVVAAIRFMVGALRGEWGSLAEPGLLEFLLWGRAVTATLGTLTVVVVHQIGLRWNRRYALLAAGLMAVIPLHVRESHFVLTDVPVTFFVALTLLAALRAHERPTLSRFALAGVAGGVAAATKYPGVLALVLPLLAVYMSDALSSRIRTALTVITASAVTFILCAPYTLLDLDGFLDGYAKLMMSYAGGTSGTPGWEVYLKHLRQSFGWPAYIAVAAGSMVAFLRAIRGPWRAQWVLLLVFPLLYFWFISAQALIYGRYLLPLVPAACLLAAAAVMPVAARLRRLARPRWIGSAAVAAITAVVILPPVRDAVGFNIQHGRKGTPALASEWIRANIPAGASIVWEGTDLSLTHLPYKGGHVHELRVRPYERYVKEGVQYLVASSQRFGEPMRMPQEDPEGYASYSKIFAMTEEVARFTPNDKRPGPELRILKVRN